MRCDGRFAPACVPVPGNGFMPRMQSGRKIPTQRRRLSRLTGLQGFGMLAPPRQDGMHWKGIPLCQGPRHRQDAGPGLFLSTRTTPARRSVGSGRVPRSGLAYTWGAARAQADALQRTRLPSDRGGFGVAQPARLASHPVRKGLEDGARQRLWPSDDSQFPWSALPAQIGRREQAVPTPDCDRAAGPGAPVTTPMRIADAAAGSHPGWAAACRHAAVLRRGLPGRRSMASRAPAARQVTAIS